jgi:hypothetical protein
MLANITRLFAEFCVNGITVDRERCELMEQSSALATPLAPISGYALAADISRRRSAAADDCELVLEKGIHREELDQILSPHELTEPGVAGGFRMPRIPEGYEPRPARSAAGSRGVGPVAADRPIGLARPSCSPGERARRASVEARHQRLESRPIRSWGERKRRISR